MTTAEIKNFINLGMVQKVLIFRHSFDQTKFYSVCFKLSDGVMPHLSIDGKENPTILKSSDDCLSIVENYFPALPLECPIEIILQ
jgi:hypothetical protein